tara:strand:- start:743 stop:856 length:114 start_codon:yes stop_codon:yes gene_type:complete
MNYKEKIAFQKKEREEALKRAEAAKKEVKKETKKDKK